MSQDLTDRVTARLRASYVERRSANQAAPLPLFVGPDAGNGNLLDTIVISATNPYNPFGFDLGPGTYSFIGRRMIEAGPRHYEQTVDTWNVSGTLDVVGDMYTALASLPKISLAGLSSDMRVKVVLRLAAARLWWPVPPPPQERRSQRGLYRLGLGRRHSKLRDRHSKLRGQDLNLRPRGYEPRELPGCSTPRHAWILA